MNALPMIVTLLNLAAGLSDSGSDAVTMRSRLGTNAALQADDFEGVSARSNPDDDAEPLPAEVVVADPLEPIDLPALVSMFPPCDSSLWRERDNYIDLTFDLPIEEPGAGDVQIVELRSGGTYGDDVTGQFTFCVLGDGVTLRAQQNGPVAPSFGIELPGVPIHRRWYGILVSNWTAVAPFKQSLQVLVGDVNGNNDLSPGDMLAITTMQPFPCLDVERLCPHMLRADVNVDNRVTSQDVSAANGRCCPFRLLKPSSHDCQP